MDVKYIDKSVKKLYKTIYFQLNVLKTYFTFVSEMSENNDFYAYN